MKKLLVLLVVGSLFTVAAFAQEVKQDPAEWEKQLKEKLKMTPEQTAKFDAISKEYKDKIDQVMADTTMSKEVQKEKKTMLKKEKETKILAILTPEQQAIYKEFLDKKKTDGAPL